MLSMFTPFNFALNAANMMSVWVISVETARCAVRARCIAPMPHPPHTSSPSPPRITAAAAQLQCTGIKRGKDHVVGRTIRFAIRIIATIGRDDEAINRIKPNRAHNCIVAMPRVANKSECVERRKDLVAANPARSSVGTGAPRTNSSMAERSAGDTESQSNSPCRKSLDPAMSRIFNCGADRAIIETYVTEEAADERKLGRRAGANRKFVRGWSRHGHSRETLPKCSACWSIVNIPSIPICSGRSEQPSNGIVHDGIFKFRRDPTAVIIDGARAAKDRGDTRLGDTCRFHGSVFSAQGGATL